MAPVPASVAAADRVTFQQITTPDYAGEAGKTAQNIMNGFWFAVWATVLWWLLLFVVGAAFISLAPRLVSDLATLSAVKPFRRLGVGTLTLPVVLPAAMVMVEPLDKLMVTGVCAGLVRVAV